MIGLFKKDPNAQIPSRANKFDAGLDLYANKSFELLPQDQSVLVPTGLVIALPVGYAGLILPRSGLAAKYGVTVTNSPGLIDSGYRGEIFVSLTNHHPVRQHRVEQGDRIAQLLIVPFVWDTQFMEFDSEKSLNSTFSQDERGDGGFGSSGK
jgi:dUTP pyrophosphatase